MKEYGLTDEELRALGEDARSHESDNKNPEPEEMWDGDFDFLVDTWLNNWY